MMQDYIRTGTYQRAILANLPDFKDKVVLDVGAGSGILSFFAIQAGARKVYAVEASTMAQHAEVSLHLVSVSIQLHFNISSHTHTHTHTLVCIHVCVCVCVCETERERVCVGSVNMVICMCLSRHVHLF